MTTRSTRPEQFIVDKDAPEGTLGTLLCEDHDGTYTLPLPCRRVAGGWLNERTGQPIDADVIGWREWSYRQRTVLLGK
jgi:hypothetical protein